MKPVAQIDSIAPMTELLTKSELARIFGCGRNKIGQILDGMKARGVRIDEYGACLRLPINEMPPQYLARLVGLGLLRPASVVPSEMLKTAQSCTAALLPSDGRD